QRAREQGDPSAHQMVKDPPAPDRRRHDPVATRPRVSAPRPAVDDVGTGMGRGEGELPREIFGAPLVVIVQKGEPLAPSQPDGGVPGLADPAVPSEPDDPEAAN